MLVGGLLTPYMFFPVLVGIPAGVLSWISIPVWIQVFFAQVGLGGQLGKHNRHVLPHAKRVSLCQEDSRKLMGESKRVCYGILVMTRNCQKIEKLSDFQASLQQL